MHLFLNGYGDSLLRTQSGIGISTALSEQSAGQAEVAQAPLSARLEGPQAGFVPGRVAPGAHSPAFSRPFPPAARARLCGIIAASCSFPGFLPAGPHAATAGGARGPGR